MALKNKEQQNEHLYLSNCYTLLRMLALAMYTHTYISSTCMGSVLFKNETNYPYKHN